MNASAVQLQQYLKLVGVMKVEKFHVRVKVEDARVRYGAVDLLVTPVEGFGLAWVLAERVDFSASQPRKV